MSKITFTAFSDMHYKKGMYSTTVADLSAIIDRSKKENSAFMIHCGDMCNDYIGSPELINTYLGCGLPVYGVYGNHELESANNSMEKVTPLLTNDEGVVWGTKDGKIGDGTIAYYYKDIGNFRIIATDTNYSWNPNHINGEVVGWEHNLTCSYGSPLAPHNAVRGFDEGENAEANTNTNSLGPVQFEWLENLLMASAEKGKKCIVLSHASYIGEISGGAVGWQDVDALFQKVNGIKKGTVMMAINGHYHTNRMFIKNNIVYFDVNTTRNIWWQPIKEPHYTEGMGQQVETVDENGNIVGTHWIDYKELWMEPCTWFTDDALSAIVTVSEDGEITIEGTESKWAYGLVPEKKHPECEPRISSANFKIEL